MPYRAGLTFPDRWSRGAKTLGKRVMNRETNETAHVTSYLRLAYFLAIMVTWSIMMYFPPFPFTNITEECNSGKQGN